MCPVSALMTMHIIELGEAGGKNYREIIVGLFNHQAIMGTPSKTEETYRMFLCVKSSYSRGTDSGSYSRFQSIIIIQPLTKLLFSQDNG